jgi:AcrR family transcriptional regulator
VLTVKENKRAEKARLTRQRIRNAAAELFIEHGYGATALQDVAERAGVAVQTIYFTFGTKRALLKELVDVAIAGDDEPVATMDRPWFRSALNVASAWEQLQLHVEGTRRILERVAPIIDVLRAAAAADRDLAGLWRQESDPRLTVQRAAARALVRKRGARPGVPAAQAADLLYGLLSPEFYLLFVRDRGWTSERWAYWVADTLRPQLTTARRRSS